MEILDVIFLMVFPVLATLCVLPSYVPQLRKTIKTKDVSGISPSFWWLIVGYIFFTWGSVAYTWVRFDTMGATIALSVNLICAVYMLILVYRYKDKRTK